MLSWFETIEPIWKILVMLVTCLRLQWTKDEDADIYGPYTAQQMFVVL